MENNQKQIGEEDLDQGDISGVKSSQAYLRAKDMDEGTIIKITILEYMGHNEERRETYTENGEQKERVFKENWEVSVNYKPKPESEVMTAILRLSKNMVTKIRDKLKFGDKISEWTGKQLSLFVKSYPKFGKGFEVVIE